MQENWLAFQQQVAIDTGYSWPDFVVKEFEEYLRCGILAHGFLRAKCESYHFERLVAVRGCCLALLMSARLFAHPNPIQGIRFLKGGNQ